MDRARKHIELDTAVLSWKLLLETELKALARDSAQSLASSHAKRACKHVKLDATTAVLEAIVRIGLKVLEISPKVWQASM